jgi:hypothetical protein
MRGAVPAIHTYAFLLWRGSKSVFAVSLGTLKRMYMRSLRSPRWLRYSSHLWNLKIQHRVPKSPPQDPILSQFGPFHTPSRDSMPWKSSRAIRSVVSDVSGMLDVNLALTQLIALANLIAPTLMWSFLLYLDLPIDHSSWGFLANILYCFRNFHMHTACYTRLFLIHSCILIISYRTGCCSGNGRNMYSGGCCVRISAHWLFLHRILAVVFSSSRPVPRYYRNLVVTVFFEILCSSSFICFTIQAI